MLFGIGISIYCSGIAVISEETCKQKSEVQGEEKKANNKKRMAIFSTKNWWCSLFCATWMSAMMYSAPKDG